jgi:hypothetical protein
MALVGQTLTAGGDHIESPANLETASAIIRHSSLSWPRGLQQNSLLLRQDAKSLHTKNQESDALGNPTGNMDIPWAPQCIITDVKMYTYLQHPVNESWILSSSSHTIIKCHSYRQPTD